MTDQELTEYLSRLEVCIPKVMHGLRIMRKCYAAEGISLSQELTLIALLQNGKSKMSQISEASGINLSALTGIIDGLIDKNWVIRIRDPKDRRVVLSELTPAGLNQANKLYKNRAEGIRDVIEALPDEEREIIIRGFEKIVSSFE
ncbi:MAG: MarR family transcriptional regulator [Gammaproteobacteria bacterium]|nr:MarR family transcriptional regulator [Gammaproteobacteria bacterium]